MRPAKGASNLDLWSEEVQLLNLHNGLQPLHRPLGEVIEPLVILVALN